MMDTSRRTEGPGSRQAPGGRLMVRMNPILFYSVGAACLLEAAAPLHASRLLPALAKNEPFGQWMQHAWLREKSEQARLLLDYAKGIWPEFDWSGAAADLQSALAHRRAACGGRGGAHEALGHCLAAVQAETFYRCLGACAEESDLRELAQRGCAAEARHFQRFREGFEGLQHGERIGLWRGFREAISRVEHARDTTVRIAFEMLQGHWSGTPPFPDVSYGDFLARAMRMARREGNLAWVHRVLFRPWFHQPAVRSLRASGGLAMTPSGPRASSSAARLGAAAQAA
jgi:hypothetical protein